MSHELPEHKQVAESLRAAKVKRLRVQEQVFARGVPRGQLGIEMPPEFVRAMDDERDLCSRLAQLRSDAQDELAAMVREANAGNRKWDAVKAQQLKSIAAEATADLMTV
jgi:hypothetical protein